MCVITITEMFESYSVKAFPRVTNVNSGKISFIIFMTGNYDE